MGRFRTSEVSTSRLRLPTTSTDRLLLAKLRVRASDSLSLFWGKEVPDGCRPPQQSSGSRKKVSSIYSRGPVPPPVFDVSNSNPLSLGATTGSSGCSGRACGIVALAFLNIVLDSALTAVRWLKLVTTRRLSREVLTDILSQTPTIQRSVAEDGCGSQQPQDVEGQKQQWSGIFH